jgi:hypothetical protein
MKKTILASLLLLLLKSSCYSQSWTNLGVGLGEPVYAMAVYNGSLYAAGAFTTDGGTTNISHIARWNGSSWLSVGNGLGGDVYALAVYNSELYAAGIFTTSGTGGTVLNHIARWNGSTWTAVGSGLNNFVNCLHVFNNELYAGGSFTIADGSVTANRVAKWNGSAWSALGTGISGGIVNAISDYNNELYAGGTFSGFVSKFNGSVWSQVGSISSATAVYCLAAWGANGATSGSTYYLYAGGDMNVPSPGMVRWNGTSWQSAVQQFNSSGKPKVFLPTYSYLYAGGGFNINVNVPTPHSVISVAKFNNFYWDSVGTGMDGDVLSLTVLNGVLIAGGNFLHAESLPAKYIARRNTTVGIEETNDNILVNIIYPNPMMEEAILKLQTKSGFDLPQLRVSDIYGREINPVTEMIAWSKMNHEIEFRILRSGLPAGIYFYRMTDGTKKISSGKFIIE